MVRIIVTGATGFIGKALCFRLNSEGYEVVALSRNPEKGRRIFGTHAKAVKWDGRGVEGWMEYADGAYGIVNLAGESIASGRWTSQKKQAILKSRLDAGQAVSEVVKAVRTKPQVVVQASAVGFYGSCGDDIVDESSSPGKGFLAEVTKEWERSTQDVESHNVRRVIIRSGVVLGTQGGALQRLVKPFRLFAGGPMGSGRQWFSWIHVEDEVSAIIHLLRKVDLEGVFNLTSPHPIIQRDFARVLGKIVKRPSWLPVPRFMLRLGLGEMADAMLLVSQRISPKRLIEAGYRFRYPEVESALKDIFGKKT